MVGAPEPSLTIHHARRRHAKAPGIYVPSAENGYPSLRRRALRPRQVRIAIFAPWRHGRGARAELPMPFENSIKALQVAATALGIPAAAAGTYSAYQTFFSNDATCHKLRVEGHRGPGSAQGSHACRPVRWFRPRRAAGLGRHQPARQQHVGLGAQLHRLCDFRNLVAAPRNDLDRAATAVGLVGGADRSKRREQIAKPAAEGSLRTRDRGARHR
jgi:hypothetical protein